MKRVDSVRISKEEVLKSNLEEVGLPVSIAEMKLRIKADSSKGVFKPLQQAVHKYMKKLALGLDCTKLQSYFNEISFGPLKITGVRPLNEHDTQDFNAIRLLGYCSGVNKRVSSDVKSIMSKVPLEIKMMVNEEERIGYTLLHASLKKNYHNTSRRFVGISFHTNFFLLYDLGLLLTDVLLSNTLSSYIQTRESTIQYALVKTITQTSSHLLKTPDVIHGPEKEPFRSDFIKVLKQYHIADGKKYEAVSHLDKYEHFFYPKMFKKPNLWVYDNESIFRELVAMEFLREIDYIKDKTNREYEQSTSYARAFETKKHIKKTHEEVMKQNTFLQRYEYVEIDNDVDLEKFFQLEDEFKALLKQIYIPHSDGSFRIKKLGKHRAAGIYFPSANATIFDLDHPDSYIHELGHQLDYTLGGSKKQLLSETLKFRVVVDSYREIMEKTVMALEESHPFRQRWQGKTAFNGSYYMQPTEIFARSFELYLHHKGVKTSFLKSSYIDYEYPNDAAYLELVNKYFDDLFEMITPTGLNAPRGKAAKPKKSESIQAVKVEQKFEQLSLFE
jgi:hypothetical protein